MRLAEGKWLRIWCSFVKRFEKREMVLASKGVGNYCIMFVVVEVRE